MSARVVDMTTQTAEAQKKYVLTSDANGISNYDTVGECVPSLAEIEEWVAPELRALGVTRAMFEGEFVRASKWGDARLSDELGLVVFSDREFDEFYAFTSEILRVRRLWIHIRLWRKEAILPDTSLDDFAFSRYSDWKAISL